MESFSPQGISGERQGSRSSEESDVCLWRGSRSNGVLECKCPFPFVFSSGACLAISSGREEVIGIGNSCLIVKSPWQSVESQHTVQSEQIVHAIQLNFTSENVTAIAVNNTAHMSERHL